METTEDQLCTGGDTLLATPEFEIDKSFDNVIHKFNEFRASGFHCDFTITSSDGMYFHTHKIILAARSTYFKNLLDGNDRKGIIMENINSTTLATILTYIYSGRMHSMCHKEAIDCWEMGVFLRLDFVVNFCATILRQTTSIENCLPIIIKAEKIKEERLLKYCLKLIQVSFSKFVEVNTDLSELPSSILIRILSMQTLNGNEDHVLIAFLNWRATNPNVKEKDLAEIFKCIILERLSQNSLRNIVKVHLQNESFPWCIDKVIDLHGHTNHEEALPRRLDDCLTLINNFNKHDMIMYDLFRAEWQDHRESKCYTCPLKKFEKFNEKMYIAFDPEIILITGGIDGIHDAIQSTWIYRYDKKTWMEGPPMLRGRNSHICCKYEDNFYVIGGYGAKESMERFHFSRNGNSRWERMHSLKHGRLLHGFANLEIGGTNCMLVFGGCNDNILNSLEMYNNKTKSWTLLEPMNRTRICMMHGVVNNYLYVFSMISATQKNGEMYDPYTNQWTLLQTMNFFPLSNTMIKKNDTLYGIGKIDTNGSCCVAVYDTVKKRWTLENERGPTPVPSMVMHKMTGYKTDTNYVISLCDF